MDDTLRHLKKNDPIIDISGGESMLSNLKKLML